MPPASPPPPRPPPPTSPPPPPAWPSLPDDVLVLLLSSCLDTDLPSEAERLLPASAALFGVASASRALAVLRPGWRGRLRRYRRLLRRVHLAADDLLRAAHAGATPNPVVRVWYADGGVEHRLVPTSPGARRDVDLVDEYDVAVDGRDVAAVSLHPSALVVDTPRAPYARYVAMCVAVDGGRPYPVRWVADAAQWATPLFPSAAA